MLRTLAATLALTAATADLAASSKVMVGRPAPAFAVTTAEGARLDIASLRGKRVLIFMWASW
jgi:cytochrome c biogenesis protein CcmG/thiol:disulfide interchange protein DsbE